MALVTDSSTLRRAKCLSLASTITQGAIEVEVFSNMSQWIVAERLVRIGRVQIDYVAFPPLGNLASYPLNQVPVRIDQSNSGTAANILQHHCLKQCSLSRSGFPDDVYVRKPVLVFDAKAMPVIPKIGLRKMRNVA